MIRALPLQSDMLNRNLHYAFQLTGVDGALRILARRTDTANDWASEGWYTPHELEWDESVVNPPTKDGWEIVTVRLPRDVAAALADAILTETTGVAPTDARALRQDLQHERQRRDGLEDALIDLVKRAVPRAGP